MLGLPLRLIFCTAFLSAVSWQAQAIDYTLSEALARASKQRLYLPPVIEGTLATLNAKGFADNRPNPLRQSFIAYAAQKKVLEIGGAYGDVMLNILEKSPDTIYHLNDLDERHLLIAAQRLEASIQANRISPNVRSTVRFITKAMQEKNTDQALYDAILAERLFQFLSPTELNKMLDNLDALLKPGGRIYVNAITPYIRPYQLFLPNYEQSVAQGKSFPGYIRIHQKHLQTVSYLLLDDRTIRQLFEARHFKIIECRMFPSIHQSHAWSLDGRENVLLIAEKPQSL